MLVALRVAQSHGFAFRFEKSEQIELFLRRRIGIGVVGTFGVGLRIDFDIAQETIEQGIIILA